VLHPNGLPGRVVPVADHSRIAALVVKDETLLRPDVVDVLSGAGYEVLRANDADEALGYLRSGRRIDVVIIDIDLGGGPIGWGVAKTFRLVRSDIPVIYTSSAETWHRILTAIDWLQEKPTDGAVVH
jgi:CheY-like chemotaxis protein